MASDPVVTFNSEETIPAGGSATYTMQATVNNFTTSTSGFDAFTTYIAKSAGVGLIDTGSSCNGSVNCSGGFLRDNGGFTGIYGLANTATGVATKTYSLLWSDDSAASPIIHSYTNGSASADWYDGYLILTANTASENVVAH